MSKQLSKLILICCLVLAFAGCTPAPDPAQVPQAGLEEDTSQEANPTDTSQPASGQSETDDTQEEAAGVEISLTSPAFAPGEAIPLQFSCDGDDLSPELTWSDLPDGSASLVLIMDDPDAPAGSWDHWILFDISPDLAGLPQGGSAGTEGYNSWNQVGYRGPCPPGGTHRYVFKLVALDIKLGLPTGTTKAALEAAMPGHILGQAELMGRFSR